MASWAPRIRLETPRGWLIDSSEHPRKEVTAGLPWHSLGERGSERELTRSRAASQPGAQLGPHPGPGLSRLPGALPGHGPPRSLPFPRLLTRSHTHTQKKHSHHRLTQVLTHTHTHTHTHTWTCDTTFILVRRSHTQAHTNTSSDTLIHTHAPHTQGRGRRRAVSRPLPASPPSWCPSGQEGLAAATSVPGKSLEGEIGEKAPL